MKKPNKEQQARINHGMALVEQGVRLIQEGDAQLRSLHVTVTNPLADVEVLGHRKDGAGWQFPKSKIVERFNARSGTRNSVESERQAGRAKAPRAARRL